MTIWAFLRSSRREIFLPQRWVIAPHCFRNVGGRPKGKYTTLRHCTRVVIEFNPLGDVYAVKRKTFLQIFEYF